jgi:endonuclease/exonuclease/phosphatase family metal-dependent hydrolase
MPLDSDYLIFIKTVLMKKTLMLCASLFLMACFFSFAHAQPLSIPWQENFSGIANGELPDGWTRGNTANWGAFNAANAGGTAPEMTFWWQPVGTGVYELTGPEINTSGLTALAFSFKHRIRNFGAPGIYTLKVEAIADGTRYLIAEWADPATVPAEALSFTLDAGTHGVGAEDFRIAWVFDGTTDNITQWDIDDISLSLESTGGGALAVTPDSYPFPDQQIFQSSAPQVFSIENVGNAPLLLSPAQIRLESQGAQSAPISIMTYNIWFDSQNWPARFNYMLSEIRQVNPDVICLQEVIQRANLPNQAASMADSLGYHYVFSSRDPVGSATRFGNAILSRYPIVATNSVALAPLNDFRTALHIQIQVAGNTIDVYNTHLHNTAVGKHIRIQQIEHLKDFIADTQAGGFLFLCGDFNANPDWEEMELVYEDFTDTYTLFHENHLAPEHGTLNYHLDHQQRRIDYIFFGKQGAERIRPLNAEIFLDQPSPTGIWGSDHFAVRAAFSILSDVDDFVLENISADEVLLPGESATVQVRFAPNTVGLKEIFLVVDTLEIPVSGLAFDARVLSFPWFEGFDGLPNGALPQGWSRTHPNWGAFNSNTAGGTAPEMNFWWQPITSGALRLTTPEILTPGLDSMQFSFKHRVRDFGAPGPFSLKVLAIAGGTEYLIQEWADPGNIDATEFETTLYRDEHGIGADTFQLAWVFEGTSSDITQWDLDDVSLRAGAAMGLSPGAANFGAVVLDEVSEPAVFTITNVGGDTLRIAPEDILITGPDAAAFVLVNLEEEAVLAAGESATVSVSFAPVSEGLQEAALQVKHFSRALSGEGFDPTVRTLPWIEGFDGLAGGGLPVGWNADAENWGAFNANNAGGTAPEMTFWWQPESQGVFPLLSPKVQTGDLDSLRFSFKYRVRNFGSPGIYTLKVVTIVDGEQRLIAEWVNPAFIGATEFSTILTQAAHGLGDENLRFAWIFDGQTDNITQWDIDDILLDTLPGAPSLALSAGALDFGNQETGSTSAPQTITISNSGGGELVLQPEDIRIEPGADADDFILTNITEEITLSAFQSVAVTVAFAPTTSGPKQAILKIADQDVVLTGTAVEPSPYFVYSDFTIVLNGREYTNVGGFREVAGFSAGNMTALDQPGIGEYGDVAVELTYNTGLTANRSVYYMWAFPPVNLSAFNRIVLIARAETPATSVKINLQDTQGVGGTNGGSETFIDIGTDWTLFDIPVTDFDLAPWATTPPNMAAIQKIDMEFVHNLTAPAANKVWIDLVGLYFDPTVSSTEAAIEKPVFQLFPNPAQSHIWVQTEEAGRLEIWSVSGRLLKAERILSGGNLPVSVSDLPAGVYFVRFHHSGGQAVKKLVKQ